jgi:hypothetical protein
LAGAGASRHGVKPSRQRRASPRVPAIRAARFIILSRLLSFIAITLDQRPGSARRPLSNTLLFLSQRDEDMLIQVLYINKFLLVYREVKDGIVIDKSKEF